MIRIVIFWILIIPVINTHAQKELDVTAGLQAYPTGLISGLQLDKGLNVQSSLHLRIGYNWFRHRDLGVHDDERGGGWGGSLGYRRYFNNEHKGWNVTVKSDVWWNEVDWYDIAPNDDRITGMTSITVIQPTVEMGFTFLTNSTMIITPSLAFGFEWNVKTNGAPTGEGAIILAGISFGKRL